VVQSTHLYTLMYDLAMRIFWWNGGLHIEPVTDGERDALLALTTHVRRLELTQLGSEVLGSPVVAVAGHNEQAVGGVHGAVRPDVLA
jgi:hypothetical protein